MNQSNGCHMFDDKSAADRLFNVGSMHLGHSVGPLCHGAVTRLALKREPAVSWVLFLDQKKSHRLVAHEAQWLINRPTT